MICEINFLDQYVPKIRELGLDFPDPKLNKNAEGVWEFSDPNWNEFYASNKRKWTM